MDKIIQDILTLIQTITDLQILHDELSHYHKNDIARTFEFLTDEELEKVYQTFDEQELADIFSYLEEVTEYIQDLETETAADVIELMDSDDAKEVLEELPEEDRSEILELMDEEVVSDIELIDSYEEDQLGSYMSNNYIAIKKGSTVKEAMKTVINEASRNDNFTIIYVINEDESLYGAIELRDLIKARKEDDLEEIIKKSYPTVLDTSFVDDTILDIREYELDSIPVVNINNILLGVITTNDILDAVEEELSDDYAKLAGLTSEEELDESIFKSVKKRIPWLCALLVLGLIISLVVKGFEAAIVAVPAIVFFQSMILGMGGNVGTQSLAVTIRAISDDQITTKEVIKLVFKELRIAFLNGVIIALISFVVVSIYLAITKETVNPETVFNMLDIYKIAGVVSISLLLSMLISGLIGTIIPIILQKLKIDPAVASGPFITSINDVTAIVIYYGIALIVFSYLL
ncbi:MAG: magnesium transporter [Bacilli bacterium]|nr:magnesium transporter [Bacilli bacterium]